MTELVTYDEAFAKLQATGAVKPLSPPDPIIGPDDEEWELSLASYSIGNTRGWARFAHGWQKDKNGLPYVTHLDGVAANVVRLLGGVDKELVQAAYLHDTLEDTKITRDDLEFEGFSDRVIGCVNAVTKQKGEANYNYISRVISYGFDAQIVKLADLYHNTHSERLSKLSAYTKERLEEKYLSAIFRIENALINSGFFTGDDARTVTFEQAYEAVQVKVSTSWKAWQKRSPASTLAGDLIRFTDPLPWDVEPDTEYLIVKRYNDSKGRFKFALEGVDVDVTMDDSLNYETKLKGAVVAEKAQETAKKNPNTVVSKFVPTWIYRLGLPDDWKVGDEVPKYLHGEKVPTPKKVKAKK